MTYMRMMFTLALHMPGKMFMIDLAGAVQKGN
jgi:hypothetical protein